MIVAFRRHTLLPLDDCLYALQPTIAHLTRSSLHRCLQRHPPATLRHGSGNRAPDSARCAGDDGNFGSLRHHPFPAIVGSF